MTTAIICTDILAQTKTDAYLKPNSWQSLSQWWGLFRDVRLLLPTTHVSTAPAGWVRVPDFVEAREISPYDANLSFLQRRRIVKRNAWKLLEGVDLLYARLGSYLAFDVYAVARKRGIALLTEYHGDWRSSILAQTGGVLKTLTRRLRAEYGHWYFAYMARKSLAVVTIGPALAETYAPPGKPVLVTTNNHTCERDLCPRTDFSLKIPPRILFVGGLEERKGLRYLFESLKLLLAAGQNFQFIAVGSGPEQAKLLQLARQGGFADKVTFAGEVLHGPQLLDYYRQADVFVLPSIGCEGVPRVIQEAMTVGCPVIATDIGGTQWQLQDGAGIVVPPFDVIAMKDALLHVLGDEQLRRRLSDHGLENARRHCFERQSDEIAQFIRSTIPLEWLAGNPQQHSS
jgi:glycosyltransferase involved in cell wall biosynthesis